ncbi:acyl carrier protein [Streptomyces tremellae]|uniref:Acyl carrier protein n=1 Tax=Streptomyces tremellae TaxID=1124239 RepID=A0ABP7EYR1_9ACTN
MTEFTLDDVRRVMRKSAGDDETTDFQGDILDVPFTDLGLDSLAVLGAVSLIEQQYGVSVPDDRLPEVNTAARMIAYVMAQLGTGV